MTSHTHDLAVHATGLVKSLGDHTHRVRAVDAIDLDVRRGEIFGVLGPNGAGTLGRRSRCVRGRRRGTGRVGCIPDGGRHASWHAGPMSSDLIMLFVCIGIALIGVLAAAVAFRRRDTGRMVQAGAVVLLPIALYFTGLLRLVVQAGAAVGVWAATLALSPLVWIGFGLLAVTVVLWVVGGFVARRRRDRVVAGTAKPATRRGGSAPAVGTGAAGSTGPASKRSGKPAAPVDEDMAEIEALLKRRGID